MFDGSSWSPVRKPLISHEILGEYVVYDGSTKKAHHLNATLSWIWDRCDGNIAAEELAVLFQREFGGIDSRVAVLDGLRQLAACELLEPPAPVNVDGKRGFRRELSRRAIVGSSAVWPLVISMVAPTAAAAKSKVAKDKDPAKKK